MGVSLSWIEAFSSYANLILSSGVLLIVIGILGKNGIEIKEIKLAKLDSWQIIVSNILGLLCIATFVFVTVYQHYVNVPTFEVIGKFVLWDWEDEQKENKVQVELENYDNKWKYKTGLQNVIFGEDFKFTSVREGRYKIYIFENQKKVDEDIFHFDKRRRDIFLIKENGVYNIIQGDWLKHVINIYNRTPRNIWKKRNRSAAIVEKLMNGDDSRFVESLQYTSISIRILEKTCGGDQDTYNIQKYIMHSDSNEIGHLYLRMRSASGLMCSKASELRKSGKNFLFSIINENNRTLGERVTAASYLYRKGEGERLCVIDQFVKGLKIGFDTCKYCEFIAIGILEGIATNYFHKTKDEITKWNAENWDNWWKEERRKREDKKRWNRDCYS